MRGHIWMTHSICSPAWFLAFLQTALQQSWLFILVVFYGWSESGMNKTCSVFPTLTACLKPGHLKVLEVLNVRSFFPQSIYVNPQSSNLFQIKNISSDHLRHIQNALISFSILGFWYLTHKYLEFAVVTFAIHFGLGDPLSIIYTDKNVKGNTQKGKKPRQ